MNGNNITEDKALEERAKFIGAFNGTMIDIWKEKIVDMDIIDTGSLLDSVAALPVRADGRFSEVVIVQCFLSNMAFGRITGQAGRYGGEILGIYIPDKKVGRK